MEMSHILLALGGIPARGRIVWTAKAIPHSTQEAQAS